MVRDASRRKQKYEAKVDAETLRTQTLALKPSMVELETTYFAEIASIEQKVKSVVEAYGVTTLTVRDYLNFAREMYELSRKFSSVTLAVEAQQRVDKWASRGLNGTLLVKVAMLFGVTPTAPPTPELHARLHKMNSELDHENTDYNWKEKIVSFENGGHKFNVYADEWGILTVEEEYEGAEYAWLSLLANLWLPDLTSLYIGDSYPTFEVSGLDHMLKWAGSLGSFQVIPNPDSREFRIGYGNGVLADLLLLLYEEDRWKVRVCQQLFELENGVNRWKFDANYLARDLIFSHYNMVTHEENEIFRLKSGLASPEVIMELNKDIVPKTTDTLNIGSSSKRFASAYIKELKGLEDCPLRKPFHAMLQFPSAEALDTIAVTNPTDTTEKQIIVSLPSEASIVRVMLGAFVTAMNNSANAQKIDVDVKGRVAGGSWSTFFSQDDVIGFPASDGATTGFVPLQDVSALVTGAGTYGFKCTITQSSANSVRYTTQYILVVTYQFA